MKILSTLLASVLALVPLSLQAEDTKNIKDWEFGKTVQGMEPSKKNLKGKVVVIEYWGVN